LDFDILSTFNSTGIRSNTILLRSGGLDLESDWVGVRVMDQDRSLDELCQRAWKSAAAAEKRYTVHIVYDSLE
jgi:hypothetical protein